MKKRLKRKLHKMYISEIVCDISQNNIWRKKLFESESGTKFFISQENLNDITKYIRSYILRYNLKYYVWKVEGEVNDWDFYYEGGILFKFQSVEFEDIYDYSFNNTSVI